jgi:hypothetical protein
MHRCSPGRYRPRARRSRSNSPLTQPRRGLEEAVGAVAPARRYEGQRQRQAAGDPDADAANGQADLPAGTRWPSCCSPLLAALPSHKLHHAGHAEHVGCTGVRLHPGEQVRFGTHSGRQQWQLGQRPRAHGWARGSGRCSPSKSDKFGNQACQDRTRIGQVCTDQGVQCPAVLPLQRYVAPMRNLVQSPRGPHPIASGVQSVRVRSDFKWGAKIRTDPG